MTPTQRMKRFRKEHPNYNKMWMRASRAKSCKATKMILGVRVKINLLGDTGDRTFESVEPRNGLRLQKAQ